MNESLEISIDVVTRVLNAMYWTFSPYLDYIDDPDGYIDDYPWIIALIESYNELVLCIPEAERYEHKIIEIV